MMAAMHIDLSISRIRAYRRQQGWSVLRLANTAGLRESTIRQLEDPNWSPTASTLRKLEAIVPADFQPPVPVNENGTTKSAPEPVEATGGSESPESQHRMAQ
ncbi:MAG: helix-turn-helix transcriptional regulator [Rhodospirillaceae bacterium]|nr:helix-turn-helix transcriptional regulator [Rhodospirillaceae bacterium]